MSISQCAPVPTLVHESRPSSRGLSRVPAVLPRRTLRQILNRALGTPSQLDAFLIDYFPDIFRQTSGGMDREEKLNQLLKADSETHLTSLVHREFPQQVADTLVQEKLQSLQPQSADADHESTLQIPPDERRQQYTIVLSATIDEMYRHRVEVLLRHLRRYTCDAELTIEAIRSGSVILTCTGTQYGLQKLFEDFEQGRLSSLLEFPIVDIVQNLPIGRVPQLRIRKSQPPLRDSRITARLAGPTVAQRIEEITTQRLQPQMLTQSMAAPGSDRAQPVPGRVITSNGSAEHCWQHEDTHRIQLPEPRWSFRRAAITSVAGCIGLVLGWLSFPASQPKQKSVPQQDAVSMSRPPSPSRMAVSSHSILPPVTKKGLPELAPRPHPNRLTDADSILQECVQRTFPMVEPGKWLLTREQDGYVQRAGPLSKPNSKLSEYQLYAISSCFRRQGRIELPLTLRIKVFRSVQDEGRLHIVVDTAASGINSNKR